MTPSSVNVPESVKSPVLWFKVPVPTTSPSSNTESWVVEDVSADGYGALVPASATDWIRVGEIIGVRVEGSQQWGIGLVRRVSRDEQRECHVGIEMISHSVIVVRIASADKAEEADTAILLTGTADANGEVGLVTRAGRYDPGSNIQVNGRTKSYFNPLNRPAPPTQDTSAFATCP